SGSRSRRGSSPLAPTRGSESWASISAGDPSTRPATLTRSSVSTGNSCRSLVMAKKAQVYARELSEDEIVDLAIRALDGPESLDALFAQEVFGGRAPLWWRDWPPHAQRAWDASVRMGSRVRDLGGMGEAVAPPTARIDGDGVSVDQAWDVVPASRAQQNAERRLSWAELAYRVGRNPQRAERFLRKEFGFAFAG